MPTPVEGPRAVVDSIAVEDVDALANAAADGLRAEYVQLEAKPFSARWRVVVLEGMVVQFARVDTATVRRVRVPQDRWAFVVPLMISDLARWNAHAVQPHDLVVCEPGSECFAFDPGGSEFAIISLPSASHPSCALRLQAAGDGSTMIALRETDAAALRRALGGLEASIESGRDALPANASFVVDARLKACINRAETVARGGDASRARSQIVQRAEAFYRRHVGEAVSIAQLSSIAGVSERSLRNAFYDMYTTSPKRYLKLWQLHQARRALRAADASVTDVATLNGFYELGRFAGEYKALFGEVPSQTLQRARVGAIGKA